MNAHHSPVALITGAARRVGAAIVSSLHRHGYNTVIHYHRSQTEAEQLAQRLNAHRPGSAITYAADLRDLSTHQALLSQVIRHFNRLDVLINNASIFAPSGVNTVTPDQWDQLFQCNSKAPFFLCQQAAKYLSKQQGHIINITDVHALNPLKNYTVYGASKAALLALTHGLAQDLAPEIRVNAIAPGQVAWPEGENARSPEEQAQICQQIPLKRVGCPEDVAETVVWLLQHTRYLTGQTIHVAGGRLG